MVQPFAPVAFVLLASPLLQDATLDPVAPVAARGEMPALVRRYAQDRRSLQSFYSLRTSATRAERLDRFTGEWRARLAEVDFDALDRSGQVDYVLLENELSKREHERAAERERLDEVRPLLPFLDEIVAMEEARWTLSDVDPRAAAKRLSELAEEIEGLQARVKEEAAEPTESDAEAPVEEASSETAEVAEEEEEEPLFATPVAARRAATAANEARRALDGWFDHYDAYEPEFGWWVRAPRGEVKEALEDYAKHLKEKIAGLAGEDDDPLVGEPIGRPALEDAIRAEMLPYSPEELLAIGEKEFAWCTAEMEKAAAELGFDGDWRAALEHVKGLHVPPGDQDDLVARQARDAIAFLDDRGLVTVEPLCRETWRLEMLSESGQRTLPFAAYGGQKMLVAYPTAGMDHAKKEMSLRGNNVHFSRIVTPHELIPGHHLQGYMAQRYATHRSAFRTPFLTEGWALYWEMLLWDEEYARGPEDRVGMLFWRMHRCARILVSLKYHLGEMTTEEMIDFLVERVGHEREGATSEVRRYVGGGYGPLYQCAYMLGGLQLRALYGELVEGGRMTARGFHDAVLSLNAIPVEMVRASLTDVPLTRDWQPSWRFAGDPE